MLAIISSLSMGMITLLYANKKLLRVLASTNSNLKPHDSLLYCIPIV